MGRIGYKHTAEARMKISEASKLPRKRKTKDLNEEFDKRYIPVTESGCWIWVGNTMRNGYGVLSVGARGKSVLAHRFSYRRYVGELFDNEFACHHCDVPSCVNPYHLFKGTASDNMKDCWKKGRGYLVGGATGESHPSSKISSSAVVKIRSLYADGRLGKVEGKYSGRELAKMFNTTYATVMQIVGGTTWRRLL